MLRGPRRAARMRAGPGRGFAYENLPDEVEMLWFKNAPA
jgi:hypothetical protein